MISITSIFYGFLFLYAGFNYLTSGGDPVKRENAKEWIKNAILMILLINASFYLYDLLIQLAGSLNTTILSYVDPNFFSPVPNSQMDWGLSFFLGSINAVVIGFNLILLAIRYAVVSFGIIFLPIGIFLYFVSPLKYYGKIIVNILMTMVFITTIESLIIVGFSALVGDSLFVDLRALLILICFFTCCWFGWQLLKSGIRKAGIDKPVIAVKSIVKYVVPAGV